MYISNLLNYFTSLQMTILIQKALVYLQRAAAEGEADAAYWYINDVECNGAI